jgi:integrase
MQFSSDSNVFSTSSSSPTALLPPNAAAHILTQATPAKRKRGKSLSRRTGQDGHIEKSGRWFVVRFWKDIPGQDNRLHVRERVCPISGPGLLSKSERKRKAREIIQASGADSAEYFKEVVKQETGVTFRQQSEVWLRHLQHRKRRPIRRGYAVTIQGALDKWILPAIGSIPLANVDNLSLRPLIEKMSAAGLKPRTVNKYIEHVKQVVESLKGPNGEPIHNRKWDAETMDLPVVEHAEQKRPSLKASTVSELITASSGQEQALYVLLAATGMRVSEALAVETRHFTNNGLTITVEQQVEKDSARVVKYLKTAAAKRQVDLHPNIAEYASQPETPVCCSIRRTGHRISTEIWMIAGLLRASSRWDWMRKEWAGIHSSDSAKHGCAGNAVLRTSTTSGWRTSRKPCLRSTCTFTRNCSCDSMKLSELATDSLFRRAKMSQLYRLSRNRNRKMPKKSQRKCRRMLVVQ